MSPFRVVYVVGKGRSGSTLLDDMLGSLHGVTSLGEVRRLWDRIDEPTYTCTCGRALRACEMWGPAVAAAVGDREAPVDDVAALQAAVHSWWRTPLLLAGRAGPSARDFGALLGRLYAQLADTTGSTTLVDSSKWPVHVGMLGLVPGVEPWVLQLVRDPRAVAYSYTKHKSGTGQLTMPRFGPLHSATSWLARNIAAELGRRWVPAEHSLRVRYEDLAATPTGSLSHLASWLDVGLGDVFRDDRTLHLGPAHLVGGNPRRFDRGDIRITPDEAWRHDADRRATATVSALTAPLRARYGYR